MNVMGEITWDFPLDREKRRALWKENDKKIAYVFFKVFLISSFYDIILFQKDFIAEFPDLFADSDFDKETKKAIDKAREMYPNANALNESFVNKERSGVGTLLPL